MILLKVGNLEGLSRDRGNCVESAAESIAVFHVNGEWHAIENRCPHRDIPLDDGPVIAGEIICPLHGARFDLRTGKHQNPPAESDLKTYPVRIVGSELFVVMGKKT
ncbi:Rieske (2Fe-2S) protein [Zavarzinella formosa]|uniref:Rieske (2Fe-2S) protein n=1 Tax=Zavarzinella formosa TaxID=360055 RepID=UPI0002EB7A72|nr:non-heme iron oxygenase ferredoxin subunit [Zavarzinella formosa]